MGMSQMCTGAGDYFRISKPHSEKCDLHTVVDKELWTSLNRTGGTVIDHVENPKKNKNNENWEKLHL